MKRGGIGHPKTLALATALGIPKAHAVGLLEALFHATAQHKPRGDIGSWPNQAIAAACEWTGDADKFVEALIRCRWLDEREDASRLAVHDWAEHADDSTHAAVARRRERFVDGTVPRLGKMGKEERAAALAAYSADAQSSSRNPHGAAAGPRRDPGGTPRASRRDPAGIPAADSLPPPASPCPALPGPAAPAPRQPDGAAAAQTRNVVTVGTGADARDCGSKPPQPDAARRRVYGVDVSEQQTAEIVGCWERARADGVGVGPVTPRCRQLIAPTLEEIANCAELSADARAAPLEFLLGQLRSYLDSREARAAPMRSLGRFLRGNNGDRKWLESRELWEHELRGHGDHAPTVHEEIAARLAAIGGGGDEYH